MKIDGPLATVTFVSEKANVLSAATLDSLARELAAAESNKQVRVCIFTGAGSTFLAGADIKELAGLATPADALRFGRLGKTVLDAIARSPMISIAAINGACLGGGCELALACDFRVAVASAKIGLPEVGLGVIPGWGGTQRLPRLIGVSRAKELILTGQVISGESAAGIGLGQPGGPRRRSDDGGHGDGEEVAGPRPGSGAGRQGGDRSRPGPRPARRIGDRKRIVRAVLWPAGGDGRPQRLPAKAPSQVA